MNLLEVKGLTKHYPTFSLEDVTFSLEPGYIMGFIGKNGAGKTTTMKLIYRILSKEKGDVFFQGENMDALDEMKMKEEISLLLGGQNFYPLSTLKKIKEVTKNFYSHFDEEMYQKLSTQFELDENKKFNELSNGMKTKFQLASSLPEIHRRWKPFDSLFYSDRFRFRERSGLYHLYQKRKNCQNC